MHAWRGPNHHPRSTPPPNQQTNRFTPINKTRLTQSFAEFDREHLRVALLERSILAAQTHRQHQLSRELHHQRTATNAYRQMENQQHYISPTMRNTNNRSPNKRMKIVDHLSTEETVGGASNVKEGMKEVIRMKKHAAEIEQAEKATRHLLAVNKRKKEVERLLDGMVINLFLLIWFLTTLNTHSCYCHVLTTFHSFLSVRLLFDIVLSSYLSSFSVSSFLFYHPFLLSSFLFYRYRHIIVLLYNLTRPLTRSTVLSIWF